MILRELHDLPGFFLSVVMILTYAGGTVLMTNSEGKANDPFDNLMVEDKNKGLTTKCRKQNCQKNKQPLGWETYWILQNKKGAIGRGAEKNVTQIKRAGKDVF